MITSIAMVKASGKVKASGDNEMLSKEAHVALNQMH